MWLQKEICLSPKPRGFHLITDEVLRALPELRNFTVGMMNVFIQHTSAALTLNENADPAVREDFESWFSRAVREEEPYYLHNDEGADDLPAHQVQPVRGEPEHPVEQWPPRAGYLARHLAVRIPQPRRQPPRRGDRTRGVK